MSALYLPTICLPDTNYGKVRENISSFHYRICCMMIHDFYDDLLRMSETDEQDFMADYLTWMKGPGLDQDSLTVYNFGYEGPLPLPSISLTPDTTMRFNLQTSGMQTQSRGSTVVIGEKYIGRFGEIMTVVDTIHTDTQALPFAIFVETEYEIKVGNMSSHDMRVTPHLVGIIYNT